MSQDRKPWLFLKRVNTWNPLAGVKHLMPAPEPRKIREAEREKRWV